MNTGGVSVPRVLVMVAFALSCFGLLMFLWLAFGGPIPLKPQGYRMKVAFDDATTLALQADVRSAGVNVGKVVETERAPEGNRLLATLELESRFAPARTDARAILRQKTLLGETYVELDIGSQQAPPLPEGARLPDAAVADVVEFDELLRIFDPPTRRSFQRWQATLADATRGHGRDFNDAFARLPTWSQEFRDVLDILDDRERNLSGLIRNTGVTFAALTRNEAALRRLIVRNRQVFDTLAGRREALAESFQIFPGFLQESRRTMRRVSRFAVDTEPLLRDLEPVLEDAQPTLVSLRRLSPSAQRIFRDLDPLIEAGRTGFPALSRVLRGLDPTLAAVGPFLQQLNPILQYLEVYQSSVSDFINVGPSALAGKRDVPQGSKSLGHVLPQLAVFGDQSFPQSRRDEDNRGNAYLRPDALDGDGFRRDELILPNFDCNHIGGPRTADEDDPGCFVQDPNPAGDPPNTRYPRIGPAPPGGG
jgi:phospholipid/cholesterol/gamma-HCH transport system substrate-binding protein